MEIENTIRVIQYWAAERSFHNNRMIGLDVLQTLKDKIPPEIDNYQGDITRIAESQLRKACKWRRQARLDSFKKRQEEMQEQITKYRRGQRKGDRDRDHQISKKTKKYSVTK
eukprot:13756520-Ditylum_brightwellii.AAC.1